MNNDKSSVLIFNIKEGIKVTNYKIFKYRNRRENNLLERKRKNVIKRGRKIIKYSIFGNSIKLP